MNDCVIDKKRTKKHQKMICFVPGCQNGIPDPDKLFFFVPKDPKIRDAWYNAIGVERSARLTAPQTQICCSDHFYVSIISR